MANGGPTFESGVPSGATMRPRYMGRVMNTYPVSEPEMENISSLGAQTTVRFSVATLLLGLAASILTNGIFYTEFTPEAKVAMKYVAPMLLLFSFGFAVAGCMAWRKKTSAWDRIRQDSMPVQTLSTAPELIAR